MVKLFALSVLYKSSGSVVALKTAYQMETFPFFQRSSLQEFMSFASKTIVERTHQPARQSVKEREYLCHVYVRADGLAGVVISDHEYEHTVAHRLLTKVLDEFSNKIPPEQWKKESDINFPELSVLLAKYQDPVQADPMTNIQHELDETKIILLNSIEALLERGEKIGELVEKSEELSMQSKMFYKTAKKTNSCCNF